MDIQIPIMDGWEATKVTRKRPKVDANLPIFAMSANAFLEEQRRLLEVGMNSHINKPVDYDEVRRLMGEQMYLRKLLLVTEFSGLKCQKTPSPMS